MAPQLSVNLNGPGCTQSSVVGDPRSVIACSLERRLVSGMRVRRSLGLLLFARRQASCQGNENRKNPPLGNVSHKTSPIKNWGGVAPSAPHPGLILSRDSLTQSLDRWHHTPGRIGFQSSAFLSRFRIPV